MLVYGAFRRTTAPVLGVVQGRAIGFGCALAGLCDVTIASDDAQFQLPEMEHGIPPCLAMSALLGNVTPKGIMYLVYSTEVIDAQRALMMGLVEQGRAARDLAREADAFIAKTLSRVPAAVPAVKEYMRSAPRMEPQAAADFGSNLLAGVLASTGHDPSALILGNAAFAGASRRMRAATAAHGRPLLRDARAPKGAHAPQDQAG